MRTILILFLCLNISSVYAQPEKKLAIAFIQSVAKNNFDLVTPYLITAASAKTAFGAEFTKMTPAKQAEAITKMKIQLQNKWTKIVSNARGNKIDFNKLQLKQVLLGHLEGESLSPLLITYQYNGLEWDDLFLIVNKKGDPKFIIELPSDTRMFALSEESRGKNLKDFQLAKDKKDPYVKQNLKDAVEELRRLAVANDTGKLYSQIVYSGEEDNENRWKRTIDPSKPGDVESAKRIMKKLKNSFENCETIHYGDIRIEKESEGVWYVINTTCGDQKHTYAFLKINNTFVLGDVD